MSAPGLPTHSFVYDAGGRRARSQIGAGPGAVVRQFVTSDFEWDESFGLARIHVSLAGEPIASFVEPFAPGGGSGAAFNLRPQGDPLLGLFATSGALGLAGLLLLLQLAALRRAGERLGRPAVAGSTALVFLLWTVTPALGQVLPDGDVRSDGSLDAGDALRLLQLLRSGGASAEEILHGDVAPPEVGDGSLDAGDALLLLRALNGADVDADGLGASQERLLDTNPFRKDTDGDLTLDGDEDADEDDLSNAEEFAQGSDPLRPDTDEDGVRDGDDPNVFSGVVYRHADHLGSTALTTHADDTEVVRAVYRPFGEAVRPSAGASAELGEFGYTGQRFEPAPALYDYGARWYDPALGRFLQPDPIVGDPFDPQNLNRYSYVGNDPGNRVDPSGMADNSIKLGDAALSWIQAGQLEPVGGPSSEQFRLVNGSPYGTYSDLVPSMGASGSVTWNNRSGSGTSIGGAGKGTFALEQGTGNTTFGPRPQNAPAPEPGSRAADIEGNQAARFAVRSAIGSSENLARWLEEQGQGRQDAMGATVRREGEGYRIGRPDSYVLMQGREPTDNMAWGSIRGSLAVGGVLRGEPSADHFNALSERFGGIPIYIYSPMEQTTHVFEAGRVPSVVPRR